APVTAIPIADGRSNRNSTSTEIAPAKMPKGNGNSADNAPVTALANAARQGRAVSQAASARCIVVLASSYTTRGLVELVLVCVRQEREIARALYGDGELALIVRLRAGDPARNDLAGFRDVALQDAEILVVDLLDAFGSEAAELAAAEETGHGANLE